MEKMVEVRMTVEDVVVVVEEEELKGILGEDSA